MLLKFTDTVWIATEASDNIDNVQIINGMGPYLEITTKSNEKIVIPAHDPKYETVLKFLDKAKSVEDFL